MPVTATDLLEIPGLALRLLAGDPATPIRWAHSVELADPVPWLEGGELVLTTGLRLPRTVAGQRAYVDRLAEASVAGIGFGIGLGHQRVPGAVTAACAERGLVLLEVPLPTPFLAITQAVADRHAERAGAAVRRTLEHQHRMARYALNAGVTGIVRHLASALTASVVVSDAHHLVLAAAPGDGVALLARAMTELGAGARSTAPTGLSVTDGDAHLMVQSLGVGGARQGLLVVATTHALAHTDQMLLTHAVSLLSLELERPRELVSAHRVLREAVLGILLDGDLDSQAAHRPLRYFGFAPADRLVLLYAPAPAPAPQLAQCLDELPYLLAARDEGVAVLIRAADEEAAVTALTRLDVTVGISGTTAAAGLPAALRAATDAAATAKARRQRVGRYGDQRLTTLLATPAAAHLAEDLLAPLDQHPELRRSLEVFLHHNGVWETASRTLGVHRHTLHHRMNRVAGLTGLDLDSAPDRAALLLALLTHRQT
ncbi:PucR family transcriptional regulator [Actinoplanes sp. L3-i22]|uniref:PucR family transcriptional regulator n=1 Tax=Actinoplanes sp. L3-i22 TaxID=2836373 RepID=UPI001C764637|nr:PucR family transcriptional regulator [Actinoplanes sp. L3-i22]BCY10137.1 hypothetical protein L3i22_052250 [Actinoplanes sp. L3-i22]